MGSASDDVVNDFEAWATVSAQLYDRTEDEAQQILEGLGIAEVWDNADAGWAKAVAGDISELRLERVERLGATYARELQRRPPLSSDFRHQATYGQAQQSKPAAKQIGGVPFSSDPDDREPTKKMRVKDVEAHLAARGLVDVAKQPSAEPSKPRFTAAFALDEPVAQPKPGQSRTHTNVTAVGDAIEAAEAALEWPVERWARYQAELAAGDEEADVVHERYGLMARASRNHVTKVWAARFSADEALAARYQALLASWRR